MKKDISMSILDARLYAPITALPFIVILIGLYIYIWKLPNVFVEIRNSIFQNFLIFILAVFIGHISYALIKGITWELFGSNKEKAIRYGIRKTNIGTTSFHAYYEKTMEIKAYKLGIAIPGIIVGIIPASLGIIIGNIFIFSIGLFSIFTAGEDILVMWLLRNVEADSLVEDHPKRVGCYVIDKNEA
ncbi:hypothetical protein NIES267_66590 [Calothrix parasitica NIES-267]|uniref:Uncharacterized protein n=1 Tax=Calothrix parasitica NIES-267 TaxID=1973488 RepID=A0A1Z4M159_9CYAN|nr:hypothetical protein NIES267_66590 [Calothrix parasitica NIES-267]